MNDRVLSANDLSAFRAHLLQEEKSAVTISKYLRDAERFLIFSQGRTLGKD